MAVTAVDQKKLKLINKIGILTQEGKDGGASFLRFNKRVLNEKDIWKKMLVLNACKVIEE